MLYSKRAHRQQQAGGLTMARGVIAVISALFVQLTGAGPASAHGLLGTQVSGRAYGAAGYFKIGTNRTDIGRVASEALPCRPPFVASNSVATVDVPDYLQSGLVENRGSSSATSTTAEARQKSSIANVSAVPDSAGGALVQAEALTVRAHTTRTEGEAGVNNHLEDGNVDDRSGAVILNLKVAGQEVDPNIAPNTTFEQDGAKVVVNEVIEAPNGVAVNAVHISLFAANGAIRADFVIAHAETFLTKAHGQLSGFAYLSQVKAQAGSALDPAVKAKSGRQNIKTLPCNGTTNGSPRESVALGVEIPDVLTSNTSRSTVQGYIDSNGASSHSTHTVEGLSLLDGGITADAITSVADTTGNHSGITSTGEFEFVNLRIDGGDPITSGDQKTTIPLAGIGRVIIGEKLCTDDQTDADPCTGTNYSAISVYAIHVVVEQSNDVLPIGAEVIVGAAHSDVSFF